MEHESEVKHKHAVHFSSARQDHATPWPFFNRLNEEFHFTVDVCAESHNAKCSNYFTPEMDGLKQEWIGVCWMNPPYAREIGRWVEMAQAEAARNLARVVCLLPARTETKWFHRYVMDVASEVRFIEGRIVFEGSTAGAPFPSMIVVYEPYDPWQDNRIKTRFSAMPNYR